MALEFTGSSQYIGCGAVMVTVSLQEFSICYNINPDTISSDDGVVMFSTLPRGIGAYKILNMIYNGKMYIGFNGNWSNIYYTSPSAGVLTNVINTWDRALPSSNFSMYYNGIKQTPTGGSENYNTAINLSNTEFFMGIYDASYYYDGSMCNVNVYNRTLLLSEIKIKYESFGSDNITNGLVGRWLMNEKHSGSTATVASSIIDSSGNGNHGTPVNSPIYRASEMKLKRAPIMV